MRQFRVSRINDTKVKELSDILKVQNFKKISITPKPLCKENDCHNNVLKYSEMYGGKPLVGYYFITEENADNVIAVLHSVWENEKGKIIDITPSEFSNTEILFAVKGRSIKEHYPRLVEVFDGKINQIFR